APQLPLVMLRHPQFGRSAHAQFLPLLEEEHYGEAVEVFVRAVRADPDYVWSPETVMLMAMSDDPSTMDLVRGKFDDFGLRGMILTVLAEAPEERDRELFVAGLDTPQVDVLEACIIALQRLAPGTTPSENIALLRLLRRIGSQGAERQIRDQVVEVLRRNTQQDFGYVLGRDNDLQQESIEAWTKFVQQKFPDEFNRQMNADAESIAELEKLLVSVPWDRGDASRGQVVFEKRACIQCHGSRTAIGPDLKGAAGRFSRDDLFTAI